MLSFGGPGALGAFKPLDVAERLPVIELAANIPVGIAPLDIGVEFELLVLLQQQKERKSFRKSIQTEILIIKAYFELFI